MSAGGQVWFVCTASDCYKLHLLLRMKLTAYVAGSFGVLTRDALEFAKQSFCIMYREGTAVSASAL
jgi:hypothetical protein